MEGTVAMNIRATIGLLVALGVVAGYFFLVDAPETGVPARGPSPWFYAAEMDDVQGISISTAGLSQSFVLTEDGWLFEGPERIPVDVARWGGMTLLVSGPQTSRVLDAATDALAEYGLEDPAISIRVALRGDREINVRLGDLTPDQVNHYGMQGDDPGLYLVDSLWGLVLARLVFDPPNPQWLYRLDPSLIVFLAVTNDDSTVEFANDVSGWRFATTERAAIDPERWLEVIPTLGGPPSIRILQSRIEADEFARFGLDAPTTTLSVEYKPPATIEGARRSFQMEFGAMTEDKTGYYAKVVGQPYLLLVDAPWLETMVRLAVEPPVVQEEGEA